MEISFALTDRNILYERINDRVDQMLEEGLLEEAKKIYQSNIRTKAITCINGNGAEGRKRHTEP